MPLGGADILAMLADLAALDAGVTVTLGSTSVVGLRDQQATELLSDEMPGVVSADEAVHVQTGSLPGLMSGVSITVGGVAWVAREVLSYGDGAMTRVVLRKP